MCVCVMLMIFILWFFFHVRSSSSSSSLASRKSRKWMTYNLCDWKIWSIFFYSTQTFWFLFNNNIEKKRKENLQNLFIICHCKNVMNERTNEKKYISIIQTHTHNRDADRDQLLHTNITIELNNEQFSFWKDVVHL